MNIRILSLVAAFAAALGVAPQARAVPVAAVVFDTVTSLQLNWSWSSIADSAGPGTYSGAHWNAEIDVSYSGSWAVTARYKHLDGPHGETAETDWHSASISFAPGQGDGTFGTESHVATSGHSLAHNWALTVNGPIDADSGAFAYHQVTHVPEPANWALMAAGMVAIGAWRRRAR